jgi:hypothetical protein
MANAVLDVKATAVEGEPTSLMVKWKTMMPGKGWIEYGTDAGNLDQVAYDIRGEEVVDTTHWVLVKDAQPEDEYFFVIVAGGERYGDNGAQFRTRMPALDEREAVAEPVSEPESGAEPSTEPTLTPEDMLATKTIPAELGTEPSAPSAPQCDPEVYYGVRHCTDRSGQTHFIVVNLNDSHVRVQTVLSYGPNGECNSVNHRGKDPSSNCPAPYPFERITSMLGRYISAGAVAIINTDYFGPDGDHGAEGLAVRNGQRLDGVAHGDYDGNATRRSSLAFSSTKAAMIGKPASESQINPSGAYYNTVAGGPVIVRNGQALDNNACATDGLDLSRCTRVGQSAAGLTTDGRLVLITSNQSAAEVARYLSTNYSVHTALKFDGGGSSRLAWLDSAGQIQTYGGTSENRAVAEGLIIFSTRISSGCLAESPHPYSNNYNNTWTLTKGHGKNKTSQRLSG